MTLHFTVSCSNTNVSLTGFTFRATLLHRGRDSVVWVARTRTSHEILHHLGHKVRYFMLVAAGRGMNRSSGNPSRACRLLHEHSSACILTCIYTDLSIACSLRRTAILPCCLPEVVVSAFESTRFLIQYPRAPFLNPPGEGQ